MGIRVKNIFTAGESAPDAVEVYYLGRQIVGSLGNIALRDINPKWDDDGSVILDMNVDPPALVLDMARVYTAFGDGNGDTGEFKQWTHELPGATHEVSGIYTGPGSNLDIY